MRPLGSYTCTHCGETFERRREHAERTLAKTGGRIYCTMKCHGASRRVHRSDEEKKRRKAEYDRQYRAKNLESIKAKKRAHYLANHDRFMAMWAERRADPAYREAHAAYKREYQARPGWKEHKRQYDRRSRAVRLHGEEWAEAYLALLELNEEVNERIDRSDLYVQRGYYNKAQGRRREHARQQRIDRQEPQECPVEDAQ